MELGVWCLEFSMKIGVVSDTHSLPLPAQMLADFKSVDLIIHAGDFCELADVEKLRKIKELKGVAGNMDGTDIRKLFPRSQVLKLGNFSVGILHGEGAAQTILEKVKLEFKDKKVDAVIFGHSHQPLNQIIDGVLYFNPGSPNDIVRAPYCSYGILDVTEKGIKGSIVKVKD